MTLIRHELRQNRLSLIIWTLTIGFLMVVCVLVYPEMQSGMGDMMENINNVFSSMGAFTAAFGMDRVNFGEFMGFYSVECGNVIGLGGALFAALLGISALAKEEKDHTAEFLLTHPLRRADVVIGKLGAVILEILILNAAILLLVIASILSIGVTPDWTALFLLHLSNLLLQLEIALICFGLSAFLRQGGLGLGLGIAMVFYFLNIISNISDKLKFLNYFTPFAYTEGADILANHSLDAAYVATGTFFAAAGGIAACVKYCRKDIT